MYLILLQKEITYGVKPNNNLHTTCGLTQIDNIKMLDFMNESVGYIVLFGGSQSYLIGLKPFFSKKVEKCKPCKV